MAKVIRCGAQPYAWQMGFLVGVGVSAASGKAIPPATRRQWQAGFKVGQAVKAGKATIERA